MRHEMHDLHGTGARECEVYDLPATPESPWAAVTDVPCPVRGCRQRVVWYEAGYVPGYRVCMSAAGDGDGYDMATLRHRFLAGPDLAHPTLIRDQSAEAAAELGRRGGRKGGKAGRGEAKRRGDSAYYRALRAEQTKCARCHLPVEPGQGFALYREPGGREDGGYKYNVHDECIAEDVAAGRLRRVSPFAFEPVEFTSDALTLED